MTYSNSVQVYLTGQVSQAIVVMANTVFIINRDNLDSGDGVSEWFPYRTSRYHLKVSVFR